MISVNTHFWEYKAFADMSEKEWESLCDGCAKCCLHKLEDDTNGDVYYTDVACRYLDHNTCQCTDYTQRQKLVPECLRLEPKDVAMFYWLPSSCAYRLLAQGEDLPEWHPLITGDPESVHAAGESVRGRAAAEADVAEKDYEDHIVRWVD